ncbi:hypothetical protein HNQ59_002413 [Chitinivorax tropicus]|uniref:Outer membrane lipoprotein-sorting protein n=1 Tax=Chitinivorax tropicus TaxID=714531 RepID=A0A840MNS0_9PROT|nr:hypothetical protein [Chitinivorax tropicus]MBB5019115.1 hypothetical protein [Chitinivorax tropicus]
MKQLWIGLVLAASAQTVSATTDLAATLSHETQELTSEGISRITRFQERFLRTSDQVWTERLVPLQARFVTSGHVHTSRCGKLHMLPMSGKLITRQANGQLKLQFVQPLSQTVIDTEARDYPEIGFDNAWDRAYYLIDKQALQRMRKTSRPSTAAHASWYEQETTGQFTRVLWSDQYQIPLVIESGTKTGTHLSRTTINLETMPGKQMLPWSQLTNMQHRDYVDLLD